MADDTTLKIVIQDGGRATGGGSAAGSGAPAGNGRPSAPAGNGQAAAFDPYAEARKRITHETRQKQVEVAYRDLQGIPEGAAVARYQPGMTPPPVQQAGSAAAAGAEAGGGAAAAALAGGMAIAATAVVAFAVGVKKVTEAVIERGAELARFSPQITEARAKADIRETMADIREAQETGGAVGSITDSYSRIWDDVREILLPLKKFVLETLAGFLETAADFMDWSKELWVGISTLLADLGKALREFVTGKWSETAETLGGISKHVDEAMKGARGRKDIPDIMQSFFNMADQAMSRQTVDDGAGMTARQTFAQPAFSGF